MQPRRQFRPDPSPLDRSRTAPLRPDGRTTYYGVATLDGNFKGCGHDWYWDVNGIYGQQQGQADDASATSTPHNVAQALGPIANCTAPAACRSTCSAAPARSPGDARLVGVRPARQQRAEASGTSPATSRASCSTCRAVRSASRWVSNIASSSGRFDPDPVVAAGFSSDIPAQPTTRRLQGRTKSTPSSTRRSSRTCRCAESARAQRRGPLSRIIRPIGLAPRPSRARQLEAGR